MPSMYLPFSRVALTSAACFAHVLRAGVCGGRVWSCVAQERLSFKINFHEQLVIALRLTIPLAQCAAPLHSFL